MTTSDSIRRKLFFQRFFTAVDAIVNITSMKAAHLNKEMMINNLQRNKTKTGNSMISVKLPKSCIRMQKPLLKGTRWSKTIMFQDSQPRRRVVLRQRQEKEANSKVTIRLPAMRLSQNAVVQKGRSGQQTATANQKEEIRTVIPPASIENEELNTGKSLLTRNAQEGNRTSRVVPKRKRAWEDSNPIQKEVVEDMDRLFVQQHFQLHSNFNAIVGLYSALLILRS